MGNLKIDRITIFSNLPLSFHESIYQLAYIHRFEKCGPITGIQATVIGIIYWNNHQSHAIEAYN